MTDDNDDFYAPVPVELALRVLQDTRNRVGTAAGYVGVALAFGHLPTRPRYHRSTHASTDPDAAGRLK
ncbi:MAG: hypothetical protein JWO10_414 [Microbacteriaceae bacterium]|nr:hypothetical protein [Microbacteriaceae bacterium]